MRPYVELDPLVLDRADLSIAALLLQPQASVSGIPGNQVAMRIACVCLRRHRSRDVPLQAHAIYQMHPWRSSCGGDCLCTYAASSCPRPPCPAVGTCPRCPSCLAAPRARPRWGSSRRHRAAFCSRRISTRSVGTRRQRGCVSVAPKRAARGVGFCQRHKKACGVRCAGARQGQREAARPRTRVTRPSPSMSWASKNGFAQIESSSVIEPAGALCAPAGSATAASKPSGGGTPTEAERLDCKARTVAVLVQAAEDLLALLPLVRRHLRDQPHLCVRQRRVARARAAAHGRPKQVGVRRRARPAERAVAAKQLGRALRAVARPRSAG